MARTKGKSKGRNKARKQESTNSNFLSNLIVAVLIIMGIFYVKDNFFSDSNFELPSYTPKKQETASVPKKVEPTKSEIKKPEPTQETKAVVVPTIDVYFTSATQGGVKKVTRPLPTEGSKLTFAIEELLKGPNLKERNLGYSSEIPKGTRLLGLAEDSTRIGINLSDEFQYGGGTESQYSRLNQLIKTVLALKLNKPVYLYLNGIEVETIGGEGIILTQPLSENSLNG